MGLEWGRGPGDRWSLELHLGPVAIQYLGPSVQFLNVYVVLEM